MLFAGNTKNAERRKTENLNSYNPTTQNYLLLMFWFISFPYFLCLCVNILISRVCSCILFDSLPCVTSWPILFSRSPQEGYFRHFCINASTTQWSKYTHVGWCVLYILHLAKTPNQSCSFHQRRCQTPDEPHTHGLEDWRAQRESCWLTWPLLVGAVKGQVQAPLFHPNPTEDSILEHAAQGGILSYPWILGIH